MIHCTRCKTTENILPKPYSKRISSKGILQEYYLCNPCNTARLKKYRATKNGAAKTNKAISKSTQLHIHKQKARVKVKWAIKSGKLVRSLFCEDCGEPKITEAHHDDYEKPLKVRWLCKSCHSKAHRV